MLTLPFNLVKPSDFLIKRYSASGYIKGKFTKGVATDVNASGVLYEVLSENELKRLPEATRVKRVIRVFTNTELKSLEDEPSGAIADEIVHDGEYYRICKIVRYRGVNNLYAYTAYASLVDVKEIPPA